MRNNTKNYENKIKVLPLFIIILVLFLPVFVNAQTQANPIIPPCSPDCGYYNLLELVNNIINWVILIAVPIAAGVFAWAGILYMTTGIADKKSEAKAMLWKVFWGLTAILAAWIIVSTLVNALLQDPGSVPIDIGINNNLN